MKIGNKTKTNAKDIRERRATDTQGEKRNKWCNAKQKRRKAKGKAKPKTQATKMYTSSNQGSQLENTNLGRTQKQTEEKIHNHSV